MRAGRSTVHYTQNSMVCEVIGKHISVEWIEMYYVGPFLSVSSVSRFSSVCCSVSRPQQKPMARLAVVV